MGRPLETPDELMIYAQAAINILKKPKIMKVLAEPLTNVL